MHRPINDYITHRQGIYINNKYTTHTYITQQKHYTNAQTHTHTYIYIYIFLS